MAPAAKISAAADNASDLGLDAGNPSVEKGNSGDVSTSTNKVAPKPSEGPYNSVMPAPSLLATATIPLETSQMYSAPDSLSKVKPAGSTKPSAAVYKSVGDPEPSMFPTYIFAVPSSAQ